MNKTDIITKAIHYVGDTVNSQPTLIDSIYTSNLNNLLLNYDWSFNIAINNLTIVSEDGSYYPAFKYQYNLPIDFGRLKEIYSDDIIINNDFEIINQFLLINYKPIKLIYYKNSTSLTVFDDLFGDCLSLLIAIEYANLIGRIQDVPRLEQLHMIKMQSAKNLQMKNQLTKKLNLNNYIYARYR